MVERGGFTLIEMLVALAVFSLAAMALLGLTVENTRSAQRVETRTLGGMVAQSLAVEAAVMPGLGEGETGGQRAFAGRQWTWTRAIAGTDDPDLQRIDIRVSDAEGQAAQRVLFRERNR